MVEVTPSTATPVELSPRRGAAGPPDARSAKPGPLRRARDAASLAANVHVLRRHPVSLVHFVTRRCNARCSFCFIDFDEPAAKSAELTAAEIDAVTKTLGPNLFNVNLTGGEPFLRSDLIDIARSYFRNTGVQSIYITSNGGFPDRVLRFARAVASEFPDRKLIISISVDGFPDEHDRIRKVPGLFDKAMETYRSLGALGGSVMANIAITVSHENHAGVSALYQHLTGRSGVRAVTAILVRDEGVYEVPEPHRAAVLASYQALTSRLIADQHAGRLEGYDPRTLQGRLMNRKNEILYDVLADTYLEPRFVSTCFAGSLFGVIDGDGSVHPCEILDRPLGNLRDHGLDFGALWRDAPAREASRWIKDTRCNCSYECAWAFNILANPRYQPKLVAAALGR